MDDDLSWIELHYGDDPEEAAALRRIIAAFPARSSEISKFLSDRAQALQRAVESDEPAQMRRK
jgi:hypothetical protein